MYEEKGLDKLIDERAEALKEANIKRMRRLTTGSTPAHRKKGHKKHKNRKLPLDVNSE